MWTAKKFFHYVLMYRLFKTRTHPFHIPKSEAVSFIAAMMSCSITLIEDSVDRLAIADYATWKTIMV